MQNGSPKAISIKIRPGMVLNNPIVCSTQIVGTTAGGTIKPASTRILMTGLSQLGPRRCQTSGDHRGENDEAGDAGDCEDEAVDVGDDERIVARLQSLSQIVEQYELLRAGETQAAGLSRAGWTQ